MKRSLNPYYLITICGLLAFAPLSFMIRAMKNDVVALEYPINHFISQCIHNGEFPYWFNTWARGFPLQSNITWSVFSTPQMLFSTVFNYDIYALHVEFMFFILLSGWSMFYLLKRYFVKDQQLAQLLAIAYMLSGFMVGSTQWMLYITAAAFIPTLLASLFNLFERPSLRAAILTAVIYTMMFTSVYAALNIITTYCLALVTILYLVSQRRSINFRKQLTWLGVCALIIAILCFPVLYYSIQVINNIDRGNALAENSVFFNSNYLHPAALKSMIWPFASVRMFYNNTEGTMLDSYLGLISLVLLPIAIVQLGKKKNYIAIGLFLLMMLFLFLSFGNFTPLRKAFNILPGFSYFRHPAIFRFYFLLSLILFMAYSLRNRSLPELFGNRISLIITGAVGVLSLAILTFNISQAPALESFPDFVKHLTSQQALLIAAVIQFVFAAALIISLSKQRWQAARFLFIADIVFNTLICTPFFSVSSYTLPQVNQILHSTRGFPVQQTNPATVAAVFTDEKGNHWQNVNIYSKEVSLHDSYTGPLILGAKSCIKCAHPISINVLDSTINRPLIYATRIENDRFINTILQRPTHLKANIDLAAPDTITVQQNYYQGWSAKINGMNAPLVVEGRNMKIFVPAGKATVEFIYKRIDVMALAIIIHLFILLTLVFNVIYQFKLRKKLSAAN